MERREACRDRGLCRSRDARRPGGQASRGGAISPRRARHVRERAGRRSAARRGVVWLRRGVGSQGRGRRIRRRSRDALSRRGSPARVGQEPRRGARERPRGARSPCGRPALDAMSDAAAAAILGVIQGLTEFLPVSSTAHLILASDVLKLDPERFGLSFDVALHLGTALAVLLYFARTWIGLVADVFRGRWRTPALVVLGTAPAAIAGVLFQSAVERELRSPVFIVAGLVIGSIVFVAAEAGARQRRTIGDLTIVDALFMGAAQAIALLPGISRSGITISAGLGRELHREEATRFSFLLATPVILGAGAKTLLDARKAAGLFAEPDVLAIGFVTSFLFGIAAVAFMVRFLRGHSLNC